MRQDGVAARSELHREFGFWDGLYAPFADYLSLSGGRRVELSLTAADGTALSGVYAVAAQHANGRTSIVINPDEWGRAGVATPLRVVVRLPVTGPAAHAQSRGQEVPATISSKAGWSELTVAIPGRTIITLSP